MSQLPQPFFNPQSSQVSGFVQPFVQAPTPVQVQIGQGVDDIGPAFAAFSQTLAGFIGQQAQQKRVEDIQSGQAKLYKSRKTFKDLVASGQLDPSANPWEAYGAAQADAVVSATRFMSQLTADYDQAVASNPMILESVGNFDQFVDDRVRRAASAGVENPIWVNTFLEEINPQINSMSKSHASAVGKARREKMAMGLTAGVAADIGGMMSDPLAYPDEPSRPIKAIKDVSDRIQSRIDEVAQTIGGTEANGIATKIAMEMLTTHGDDPRIHEVMGRIKTPGGRLVDTDSYKAALAVTTEARNKARSQITLEKEDAVQRLLEGKVGMSRLATMTPQEIVAGKGIPDWDEVEGEVRKLGVGTDLYFKIRDQFNERRAQAIRSGAERLVREQAQTIGSSVAAQYAAAAGDTAKTVELASRLSLSRLQADYETFADTMSRAYGINKEDIPKSLDKDKVREEAVRSFFDRAQADGPIDGNEMVSLVRMSRALDMRFIPGVTDRMRAAVESFNMPNADPTNMPPHVVEAIELWRTAERMGETSILGLTEETQGFLRNVSSLMQAQMPMPDAVARTVERVGQSGAPTRTIEKIDPKLLDDAVESWRTGWWFDFALNNVPATAPGISRWRSAIEEYATIGQMTGMGSAQAVSKAKAWAEERTVEIGNGSIFIVANPSAGLGTDGDAWDKVKGKLVDRINEKIKAGGLAEIDPNVVSFIPVTNASDNQHFRLVFTDGPFDEMLVDTKYAGTDFADDIPKTYSIKELDELLSQISIEESESESKKIKRFLITR